MASSTTSDCFRVIPDILVNARWVQNGLTAAQTVNAGNKNDKAIKKLAYPYGLFVDDDQTVVISDCGNHRIVQWKMGDKNGEVVAGGNGKGNELNQLNWPSDVLIDKETDSFIISDRWNRRVVRWSRRSGTQQGEILIDNVSCWGLAMDDQRYLYVSDLEKHEVRRYQMGDKKGILIAGGNGKGDGLNQLNYPTYIFIDQQQALYVSDRDNNRVIKWNKGAAEGTVIAGDLHYGNDLTQLYYPNGLFVDTLGTLYVADLNNDRVMRWPKGAKQGTIIVDGNESGKRADQFRYPTGLSFDRQGNLYIAELHNGRVQRFSIE